VSAGASHGTDGAFYDMRIEYLLSRRRDAL